MLGVQALSLFSKMTYSKHEGLQIMFSPDGEKTVHRFHVDEKNRFLLQKKQLKKLPGDYMVQVKGKGCAFLKVKTSIFSCAFKFPVVIYAMVIKYIV